MPELDWTLHPPTVAFLAAAAALAVVALLVIGIGDLYDHWKARRR